MFLHVYKRSYTFTNVPNSRVAKNDIYKNVAFVLKGTEK